tara:strand:- start:3281 stop:4303 length:1023 start_codon:yes stop_codon:yes gene_type:complete
MNNKLKKGYWKLPDIQRNNTTWPKTYYREFIESIFNNSLTSPFIGSQKSALDISILDGGHRTEAIRRFFDGELKITCPRTKKELLYHELSEEMRAVFDDKTLICLVYEGLTPLHEETLFFRVNNSLPLHPGEIINGFSAIPMCALTKELGQLYADEIRESFVRSISKENLRGESSNVMLLILRNFHECRIVVGQKASEKTDVKEVCERLRFEKVDELSIKRNVKILFKIIGSRKRVKYTFDTLPTIQAIMMNNLIGSTESRNGMNVVERVKKYCELISTFFHEIENPRLAPILNVKYQALMRYPQIDNMKGVSNPGNPTNCKKRAAIFTEWLEFKGITPP